MRILARLILPFKFSFKPNVFIQFIFKEEKVIIIGQPCEGVRVLSYFTKDYETLKESRKGREFLRVKQKLKNAESIVIRTIVINKESENYLDGTIDLLKSTLFDVYFSFPDQSFSTDEKSHNLIRDKAIQILRFFINSYRTFTNEADIHNPSDLDLPLIELAYSKENWTEDAKIINGEYLFLTRIMTWLPSNATGLIKENMTSDAFNKFTEHLNSNEPRPYYLQLLADAKEQAIIRKNFNMSIVLSSTATEVYLIDRLIKECQIRNITQLTIGKGKRELTKDYEEAILKGDIRDTLIGDICKSLTGKNIKESNEYHNWYKYAYDLRNQIIHQGLIIENESDSELAFKSVIKLIDSINLLLTNSR
jgi:hypothetical protein